MSVVGEGHTTIVTYDASLMNNIYASSTTVQPKTLRAYCLIRYAA